MSGFQAPRPRGRIWSLSSLTARKGWNAPFLFSGENRQYRIRIHATPASGQMGGLRRSHFSHTDAVILLSDDVSVKRRTSNNNTHHNFNKTKPRQDQNLIPTRQGLLEKHHAINDACVDSSNTKLLISTKSYQRRGERGDY